MPILFHRVKFSSGRTHIELECTKGVGGTPFEPKGIPGLTVAALTLERSSPGEAPAMCWRDDSPVLFEQFQLRENTDYYVDVTLPVGFEQAISFSKTNPAWPFGERLAKVFRADPPRRWRTNGDGTLTVPGLLRTGNHAGILELAPPGAEPLRLEIVCKKIGYLEEFRDLLDAVTDEYTELILQIDSPVGSTFSLTELSSANEAALLFQLRHIMAEHNLPIALEGIRRRFHLRLEDRLASVQAIAVEEVDLYAFSSELDAAQLMRGGPFSDLFQGHSPVELPVRELIETTDTPENRFVKYFLEEIQILSQRLADSLAKAKRQASVREIGGWLQIIDEELSSGIWRDVGAFSSIPANSQVLQKRTGYREILKYDLSLRMGLELPWKRGEAFSEGLIGDLRPVSELYEYWCFFVLRRILADLADAEIPANDALIQTNTNGLSFNLTRGVRSKSRFSYTIPESLVKLEINLYYNRTFTKPTNPSPSWEGSYTASFHPDYSLEIICPSSASTLRHWLHFDAKYRLERSPFIQIIQGEEIDLSIDDDGLTYQEELIQVHRRDDLFKMHTYRDGILGSRGAYVLFPGHAKGTAVEGRDQNLFVRHPQALGGSPAHLVPSVGAFALCPGQTTEQEATIGSFISQVAKSLAEAATYVEEQGPL